MVHPVRGLPYSMCVCVCVCVCVYVCVCVCRSKYMRHMGDTAIRKKEKEQEKKDMGDKTIRRINKILFIFFAGFLVVVL